MAWFRNHYKCARCDSKWVDEWSGACDDDCPDCGARHMSAYAGDDLTEIIEADGSAFVVFRSSETAEHFPNYSRVAAFSTYKQAEAYLSERE